MSLIFALESSCDETAAAIIDEKRHLYANVISSQIDTHRLYGGVVPEIASRLHVENIGVVLEQTIRQAGVELKDISAFAVTKGPGLVGSLHVGLQAAKTLSLYYEKPLIGVHHLVGHIYANALVQPLRYPLLVLVVSGGHTELVYMKKAMSFELLGTTHDDAVGEAYDKVARVLGLPYPGGPAIDSLAQKGQERYQLPVPLKDDTLNFSFSGLKSAVINLVNSAKMKHEEVVAEDMAYAFQKVAITSLVEKTRLAYEKTKPAMVTVAGGVAANSYLRQCFQKSFDHVVLPPLWCCTDNAAMIASAAVEMYERKAFSGLDLACRPMLDLEKESLE